MTDRIGFIGIGLMGHGMAKNLVEKGFPLTILAHRKREAVEGTVKRGAREAKSVRELAKGPRRRRHLRHRLAAGRGGRARRSRPRFRRQAAPHHRLLDLRAHLDPAPRDRASAEGHRLRRRAADPARRKTHGRGRST